MASTQYTARADLFRNVPFDATYQHTLASQNSHVGQQATKYNWINANYGAGKYSTNKLQHIRYSIGNGTGSLRITIPKSTVHEYNYIVIANEFQNADAPYMFGFVTDAIYINDASSDDGQGMAVYQITFEIDYMMTFFGSHCKMHETSIVRMHPFSKQGECYNTYPEDIGATEYIYETWANPGRNMNDCYTVVYFVAADNTYRPTYIQGIASGYETKVFQHDAAALFYFLYNFGTADTWSTEYVLMIAEVPQFLFSATPAPDGTAVENLGINSEYEWVLFDAGDTSVINLNGYTPKWCKTARYPYNFERIYNDIGEYVDLKFEEWGQAGEYTQWPNSGRKAMRVEGCVSPPVTVLATPLQYMQANSYYAPYKSIQLSDYPLGSWRNDSYQNYVATSLSGKVTHTLTDGLRNYLSTAEGKKRATIAGVGATASLAVAGTAAVLAGGAAIGGASVRGADSAMQGVSNIGSKIGGEIKQNALSLARENLEARWAVDTLGGSLNNHALTYQKGHKTFYAAHVCVPEKDARYIDDYFTRYGYNFGGQQILPFDRARTRYTYLQTAGDTVHSAGYGCSATVVAKIDAIINSGITFWDPANNTASTMFVYDYETNQALFA